MAYVKSFVAGLTALLVTLLILAIGLTALNLRKGPPPGNDRAVTWDFREALGLRPWQFWLSAAIIFGLAFYWEFRRASR